MNPIKLQEIANSNNISGDVKELAGNKTIVDIVYKDLVKCANVGKLGKAQTPTAVHLETEPWLPETGLVTDALKIKRKVTFLTPWTPKLTVASTIRNCLDRKLSISGPLPVNFPTIFVYHEFFIAPELLVHFRNKDEKRPLSSFG